MPNNLAPFEKTDFVTSWSKECYVMLVMNSPKLFSYLSGILYLDLSVSLKRIFAFSAGGPFSLSTHALTCLSGEWNEM